MFRMVFRGVLAVVLTFDIFCFSNVFSETGGLKDRPISVVLVCKPSAKEDKPRFYRSTSLFFKRLKNKRIQENGTAYLVGYGSFSSEAAAEQLKLAGENGYDLYIFSKDVENLPLSGSEVVPWIGFFAEKKEIIKTEKNTNQKSKIGRPVKNKKSKEKQTNSAEKYSKKKRQFNSKIHNSEKKVESSVSQSTSETVSTQTQTITTPTQSATNSKIGNDSFELSFDTLKFWFSTNVNPLEFPWESDKIFFLLGDKIVQDSFSEKTKDRTLIRLLNFPQDLRFNDGIYDTGCASSRIPNGVSVLHFFFRGNRLIRLRQESFSLNSSSDGSGKSWELE
ncbi:LIC11612 family fibronectin-binding protein [Leptospira borgpetersenii]|uniref:Uncharacterized protein n=2 Tax=Leptospira borgpetersenii serovar Hardjo-bovis TaxID=338217 RepID=Q04T91_LEPBJ|nr:hypothetical protein [Leptospira borgpetersenii]ABJ75879.1 Hypothetical protein LBJ_1294 [Leptospira borgpetersenii serovar Hardjo-bovis str. JB197]ABJ78982.1 Hypothetical protein LBL_1519 [Leptospira borgpetersenii serovar Hardjo-bovis str. L550]AMX58277.1 hypothetical protein LBK6_07980 [Leptospira borgpetersenii serovar Hardjo]AMX61530.1 hypothetical protein LBK9_08005 [Leptospira borgpetersenii serovar Hardjo]AMX64774.1 hypothetical protein LBK30_08060 [Leptospira borgpetersenii serovar